MLDLLPKFLSRPLLACVHNLQHNIWQKKINLYFGPTTTLERFDKGYTPIASYVHHLDALRTTNENTITVGGLYAVDPLTYVKYSLNNQGKLDGLMQHKLKLKSILIPRPWITLPGSGCPLLSSLE